MHFAIRYLTEYRYDGPVTDNLNALRVKPAVTATQRVDDFGVRVTPESRLQQHLDYYGTTVIEFGVAKPHESLGIDVRARVATTPPPEPPGGDWTAIEREGYRALASEYLLPFAAEPDDLRIDGLVGEIREGTARASLERIIEVIPDRFEYRAGVTYVGSTVNDLLAGGAGVCQDFVHLALTMMRREGIACRYVSGYLYVRNGDGSASAEVNTHAWLEALLPDADGEPGAHHWVGADPTNRSLTGISHVKIGHGRAYSDVPPIRGVYRGAPHGALNASVTMTLIGA
jgi:transglutaminase-like putative cysteine protease